jgi:hypothetical protein
MKQGRLLLEVDSGVCEYEYDDITLEVSDIIRSKSKDGYWYVRVENFGWDKRSGYQYLETQIGKQFMSKILPDCECTWKMFNYGKGLLIQNWHHDSCTGEEKYYCVPISRKTFENQSYKGGM